MFYQGKHLSITHKNISARNLFKYFFKLIISQNKQSLFLNKFGFIFFFFQIFLVFLLFFLGDRFWDIMKDQKRKRTFQDNYKNMWKKLTQKELIDIIKQQLDQDDLNVLNCGMVNQLIEMVKEIKLKAEYKTKY